MRLTASALSLLCLLFVATGPALAQAEKNKEKKADESAFTLKNIFPKKSFFGPSASRPTFSHDGRYAAWLYRPYLERRHGSDLWLLDVKSGKVQRLTKATVMAEFQASARKVAEDRVKKAKKERAEKEKDKAKDAKAKQKTKGKNKDEGLGDHVTEKDADDEKAPRYGGISSFEWAPKGNEFLFTSGGDVYRYQVKGGAIERLTCTDSGERDVKYLPDGGGYTYLQGGALMKVAFGSHLVVQLDPKLPGGETMTRYQLSPDGKRLVFLASKGPGARTGGRTVKIARYRDRFMDVREVPRTVSDDPIPETWNLVYLYELAGAMQEKSKPILVHKHKVSGPRDVLQLPEWAPDSSRVAFTSFEQSSDHVQILEARFPEPEKTEKEETEEPKGDDDEKDEESGEKKAEAKPAAKKPGEDAIREAPAKVVYRFLHQGGPNTPRMMEPLYLADSRHICFLSEQTGFRHVHMLDPLYESQRPLTWGAYEVYPFDVSDDHKTLFVTATKEDPACEDVYALDLESGKLTRLTKERGVYNGVAISPNQGSALANFVRYGTLRELVLVDVKRGKQKTLTDSHPDKAKKLTAVKPEFFTYDNRHGHRIHGHMFKPKGWRKSDKRPLLIYVYGGPLGTRKQVVEGSFHSASYFFGQYMAREHGWVTVTIDPRGMSGYGGVFEKANFEQVGKPQVEDLADGVKYLVESHGVDPEKVAMHGWSFGGFQTQMCMYTEPDVFKVGIAGAGPTEWENYNSWYSTGTIGESRTGKPDLKKYSLLPLAKNLKGKLLLIHGMEDSNVLYQDTVRVYRELLKAGKETLVELFLDPTGGHGLGGDIKSYNRYHKYEEFLVRTLGTLKKEKKGAKKGKSGIGE